MNIVPDHAPWEHPYEKFQQIQKHGNHDQRDHAKGKGRGKRRSGPPKMSRTPVWTDPDNRSNGPTPAKLVAAAKLRRAAEAKERRLALSSAGRRKKRVGPPKMKRTFTAG